MKIFAGPRGSGRTTALIEWCREDRDMRVLVTQTAQRAHELDLLQARTLRIVIRTLDEVNTLLPLYASTAMRMFHLGVDDYDEMIACGRRVEGAYALMIRAASFYSEDYINIAPPVPEFTDLEAIQGLRMMARELA